VYAEVTDYCNAKQALGHTVLKKNAAASGKTSASFALRAE